MDEQICIDMRKQLEFIKGGIEYLLVRIDTCAKDVVEHDEKQN